MNRIKELREKLRLSQTELADKVGTSQPQIKRLETGGRSGRKLTKEWAEKIAPHLNVTPPELLFPNEKLRDPLTNTINLPVAGIVQAGNWRDISILSPTAPEDADTIPAAKTNKYMHARQYALLVAGDSMNLKYEEGGYVTCANWADIGVELKVGMCLHVERNRGDLTEVTLKCYNEADGKRWLEPRSSNPSHKPIELGGTEDTEIVIRGLVTGYWKEEEY